MRSGGLDSSPGAPGPAQRGHSHNASAPFHRRGHAGRASRTEAADTSPQGRLLNHPRSGRRASHPLLAGLLVPPSSAAPATQIRARGAPPDSDAGGSARGPRGRPLSSRRARRTTRPPHRIPPPRPPSPPQPNTPPRADRATGRAPADPLPGSKSRPPAPAPMGPSPRTIP